MGSRVACATLQVVDREVRQSGKRVCSVDATERRSEADTHTRTHTREGTSTALKTTLRRLSLSCNALLITPPYSPYTSRSTSSTLARFISTFAIIARPCWIQPPSAQRATLAVGKMCKAEAGLADATAREIARMGTAVGRVPALAADDFHILPPPSHHRHRLSTCSREISHHADVHAARGKRHHHLTSLSNSL